MNHQGLRQQLQRAGKAGRARLLLEYMVAHGAACYEEEVTQLQHALQAADLAAKAGKGDALIAAALLHDVGHLLADDPEQGNDPTVQDDCHEEVAANYLAEFFPEAVTAPIRLHVPAKRYLCTKQTGYYDQLSQASRKSYHLQGGPMSAAELAQFEAQPFYREAVWLRGWDDEAKDVSRQVPPIAACLRAYPGLKPSYCKGGLFFPEELSVNPRLMIHRLQAYLEEASGLAIMRRCRVHAVEESGDGCRLLSSQGEIKAKRAIVCSGSELQALYPELAAASGLQLVKLQMLRLKPQAARLPGNILTGLSIRRYESFHACPSYPAVKAKEPAEALWKQYGVHILFKQEVDGSVILGDSHEYLPLVAGKPFDFDLKTEISDYMLREAAAIFELDYQAVDRQWAGVYTQCEQGDLYQTRVGSTVHIVTGIGGKGMTAGPGFAAHHLDEILA